MDEHPDDKWLTRQDLADRYGLPVKTPAEWASKGTGPRYAKFGRHVRYLLNSPKANAIRPKYDGSMIAVSELQQATQRSRGQR